jgi:hypothetical protein
MKFVCKHCQIKPFKKRRSLSMHLFKAHRIGKGGKKDVDYIETARLQAKPKRAYKKRSAGSPRIRIWQIPGMVELPLMLPEGVNFIPSIGKVI